MKLSSQTIELIEKALVHHTNYTGSRKKEYLHFSKSRGGNEYLSIMDTLSRAYSGSPSEKVSKLLSVYYKEVNVTNLSEALLRIA